MFRLSKKNIKKISILLQDRIGNAHMPPREGGTTGALIAGLMSQNTSDHNRDIGYAQLLNCFDSWESVAKAKLDEIVKAIKPAGMMNQRAPRIKALLDAIHERTAAYSADFLLDISTEKAFQWLVERDGIGEKTAAVFLLFHRGAPYFPVDTHIRRILSRIGFFPEGTAAIKIQRSMTEVCSPDLMMNLHLEIIDLGKKICRPHKPKCRECELLSVCEYARR
ncbi:endonuclease III [bacterium]|nr:endonuclease III [bacterium]